MLTPTHMPVRECAAAAEQVGTLCIKWRVYWLRGLSRFLAKDDMKHETAHSRVRERRVHLVISSHYFLKFYLISLLDTALSGYESSPMADCLHNLYRPKADNMQQHRLGHKCA